MQIPHEEAHRLIQFDEDRALNPEQTAILRAHLRDCLECREYANSLENMAAMLSASMKKKWNRLHTPLPSEVLVPKRNSGISESILLATRIAAAGVLAIAFLFSVRQIRRPVEGGPGTQPVSAPSIPTPSAQSTSTQILIQNCGQILYIVQKNDTIESIAAQFSISKDEIMADNGAGDNTLQVGKQLVLENCTAQPTGTFQATETLFTPLTNPPLSTPGG